MLIDRRVCDSVQPGATLHRGDRARAERDTDGEHDGCRDRVEPRLVARTAEPGAGYGEASEHVGTPRRPDQDLSTGFPPDTLPAGYGTCRAPPAASPVCCRIAATRVSGEHGLARKPSAPARSTVSRTPGNVFPVTMMIGMAAVRSFALRRRHTCRPSRTGIARSRTITSGRWSVTTSIT